MIYPAQPRTDDDDAAGVPRRTNLRDLTLKAVHVAVGRPGPAWRRASPAFMHDPGTFLAMGVMAVIFYNQIVRPGFPPSLPNAFSAAVLGSAIFLLAVRRDPAKKGNVFDLTLAIVGTFSMSFMPVARYHHFSITLLEISGTSLWLWSLLCLGRSFGLAPADRGLKTAGPYHFIRHPMYAGELVDALGAVIAVGNAWAALVFCTWWLFQMLRMMKEEAVISGYDRYRRHVKWRILPAIW